MAVSVDAAALPSGPGLHRRPGAAGLGPLRSLVARRARPVDNDGAGLGPADARSSRRRRRRWKVSLFRGMVGDLRRRAPYYVGDWVDAWDYRVVPATVYMYFANILPALAFSLDMFTNTDSHYGVNEVLLASVLGAVVFSVLACQPLVIVGVTGPITVFNYTVYHIMKPTGVNYLAFMCWVGIWSLIMHWVLAITNSCNWLRYVTRFPCDIFGFYVAFIYLQKGIQVLERLGDHESFYLSIVAALLVFMVAYLAGELGTSSLFHHHVRVFLKDYGTPLTLVFFTGFVHFGRMREVELAVLPTSVAFMPTAERKWLVDFWNLKVGDVFLAIPFAILLTTLFWFDHNVSSLICQGSEFPLKKPAGFHWDLFLLGLTTGVAGLLGLPFPNGLIPQAPFHTEALTVRRAHAAAEKADDSAKPADDHARRHVVTAEHVVEQRLSNLAQGLFTLVTMTGPLLAVLHLIPHGVLAGLFFVMGVQALEANGITAKLVFLARDGRLTPHTHPLRAVARRAAVWGFVAVQLAGFAATFAITQTVAAVGFPVVIMLLIPARAIVLPRWFSADELRALDGPTASPFTMESVGGQYGVDDDNDDEGDDEVEAATVPGTGSGAGPPGTDTAVAATAVPSERVSIEEDRRSGRGEHIFAMPGGPRRSLEELTEMGQVRSAEVAGTATRRRSSSVAGDVAEFRMFARSHESGQTRWR